MAAGSTDAGVRVGVQFFARLRELTGRSDWQCDLEAEARVADAWAAAIAAFPDTAVLSQSVSAAVNAEFAKMSTPLREGDVVAFLPPVSGGAGVPSTIP
jgi:molybdopterin synthase catalytic subunit